MGIIVYFSKCHTIGCFINNVYLVVMIATQLGEVAREVFAIFPVDLLREVEQWGPKGFPIDT